MSRTIWGISGRIEVEIWHTGIGTRFMLYDNNDRSWYLAAFDEELPINGPSDAPYTELFLMALSEEEKVINFRKGSIKIKRIEDRIFIEGHYYGDSLCVLFNTEQIKELTDYLIKYINTLPQNIRDNFQAFQENCWIFYIDEKEIIV